jgi:dTDP-3-amino-3,4,6-trideoxy-alpha-D-glucose transaminase
MISGLGERGIQARPYYRVPLHRQNAMAPYAPARPGALSVTDELSRTNLALPMSPTLDPERAADVVSALAELSL